MVETNTPEGEGVSILPTKTLVESASETTWQKNFVPVMENFNGNMLIAVACVAALSYVATLSADWLPATLVATSALTVAARRVLHGPSGNTQDAIEGIEPVLKGTIGVFLVALPFVTFLNTFVVNLNHSPALLSCMRFLGCVVHGGQWTWWLFFAAGAAQSVLCTIVSKLHQRRQFIARGPILTQELMLLAILLAGLGASAAYYVTVPPWFDISTDADLERAINESRWSVICGALWLWAFIVVIRDVWVGWRRARVAPMHG